MNTRQSEPELSYEEYRVWAKSKAMAMSVELDEDGLECEETVFSANGVSTAPPSTLRSKRNGFVISFPEEQ